MKNKNQDKSRWGCPNCGHDAVTAQATVMAEIKGSVKDGSFEPDNPDDRVAVDEVDGVEKYECDKCGEQFDCPVIIRHEPPSTFVNVLLKVSVYKTVKLEEGQTERLSRQVDQLFPDWMRFRQMELDLTREAVGCQDEPAPARGR